MARFGLNSAVAGAPASSIELLTSCAVGIRSGELSELFVAEFNQVVVLPLALSEELKIDKLSPEDPFDSSHCNRFSFISSSISR